MIKPITFSAPMVLALLTGAKTQTRRLVSKPEQYGCPTGDCPHNYQAECNAALAALVDEIARFKVGDQVCVREHWSSHPAFDGIPPRDLKRGSMIYTRADALWHNNGDFIGAPFGKHRQAMHMPRWASRIWLTVTEVRVHQLTDISEADCVAEGIEPEGGGWKSYETYADGTPHPHASVPNRSPVTSYRELWNTLHREPGTVWDNNPWVVAYTFTVHKGNIDEVSNG